jgi:hypothetical protein
MLLASVTVGAKEARTQIDPRSMPPLAIYKLLIGCIVPRPIAWLSTVSASAPTRRRPLWDLPRQVLPGSGHFGQSGGGMGSLVEFWKVKNPRKSR